MPSRFFLHQYHRQVRTESELVFFVFWVSIQIGIMKRKWGKELQLILKEPENILRNLLSKDPIFPLFFFPLLIHQSQSSKSLSTTQNRMEYLFLRKWLYSTNFFSFQNMCQDSKLASYYTQKKNWLVKVKIFLKCAARC